MNIAAYTLAFCQTVTGLLFLTSSISKLRDIHGFIGTIHRFRLVNPYFDRPIAFAFLAGELLVVILMVVGGPILAWGFLLATFLLILFSGALISVLMRKIQTSCNCFGSSEKQVTRYDVIRNVAFVLCAGTGFFLLTQNGGANTSTLSLIDWILVCLVSILFVVIWIQSGEIIQFLSASNK